VAYRCVNPGCTAQLATKIRHFAGRKMLDIDMLGEEVANAIARMQDVLAVRDVLDLFHLTVADLAPLELNQDGDNVVVVGTARARKIVAGLEKAKTLPLHRWLYAIGIRTVGENTSKELSRLFRSFDEIVHHCQPGGIIHAVRHGADKASEEFAPYRISTHLGPVSAQRLMEFQQSKFGVSFAGFMERFAVVSDNHDPQPTASDAKPLVGMTFVITGTLSVDRDTMKAEIERAGGKVSGSVSKTTKYLIAGEGGGQKRKKAAALGVETIDEAGIRAMLP
jgi:DNA ligase (NAD+)